VCGREKGDFMEHSATALFGAVSVTVRKRNGTSETVTETRMELNGDATHEEVESECGERLEKIRINVGTEHRCSFVDGGMGL